MTQGQITVATYREKMDAAAEQGKRAEAAFAREREKEQAAEVVALRQEATAKEIEFERARQAVAQKADELAKLKQEQMGSQLVREQCLRELEGLDAEALAKVDIDYYLAGVGGLVTQFLEGPFSTVSTPDFATSGAFFSIVQAFYN